jgi:hypothetical protein
LIPGRTRVVLVNGGHDLGWGGRRRDDTLPASIADSFLALAREG